MGYRQSATQCATVQNSAKGHQLLLTLTEITKSLLYR